MEESDYVIESQGHSALMTVNGVKLPAGRSGIGFFHAIARVL
jgi:hypothetical protein